MSILVDYAPHTLAAQRHMHEMGDALRRNLFDDAMEETLHAIAELRMAFAAIQDLKARNAPRAA